MNKIIMKKFLYSMMAIAALTLSFTSCGDDSDDLVVNHTQAASAAAVGTYSGTWTRTNANGVSEGQGTVTIESVSEYVANVTFVDGEKEINATSVANCFWAGEQIYINQQVTSDANGLGASFAIIVDGGKLKTSFKISVKDGRKKVDTVCVFEGTRN